MTIGLLMTFVGLGDRGFKTMELKLVGPSLVGLGVFLAAFRVLLCTVRVPVRARITGSASGGKS